MIPAERSAIRTVILQAAALKEQAVALGMQAETLEKTAQAALQAAEAEGEPGSISRPVQTPHRRYMNQMDAPPNT